jgi:hypothetical protein
MSLPSPHGQAHREGERDPGPAKKVRSMPKKTGLPKQPSFNSVMVCLTYRPIPTTWPWLIVYAFPPMLTVGT